MTLRQCGHVLGAVGAIGFGLISCNAAVRAEELEFHPPKIPHEVDINANELEGAKGPGRVAPPDVIGVTKPTAAPREVPNSNLGKLNESAPPPKPMEARVPEKSPREATNAPREAPKAGEPKTSEPRETEPKEASAGEEPKNGKPSEKGEPKEKPSFYKRLAKHKDMLIQGAFIAVGVLLPVTIQASESSSQSNQDSQQ